MNLPKIFSETVTKPMVDRVVRYIGDDPKKFALLMDIFFKGDMHNRQRAAWPMSYCVQNHPELIKPYWKKIIPLLQAPGTNETLVRNILRLLPDVTIPKAYHGPIMNTCFALIATPGKASAIKAFALTVLDQLSAIYPDIRTELKVTIEEQWDNEKPAFRSRGKKILQKVGKSERP